MALLLICLTHKSKGEYGIRLDVTQLTCILEPRHSTYPFTVIISALKFRVTFIQADFTYMYMYNIQDCHYYTSYMSLLAMDHIKKSVHQLFTLFLPLIFYHVFLFQFSNF